MRRNRRCAVNLPRCKRKLGLLSQVQAANALIQQLTKTQQEYAQVITDIHSASPYYREQLSHEGQFSSLEALRRQISQIE